jgi:hypothetical protein
MMNTDICFTLQLPLAQHIMLSSIRELSFMLQSSKPCLPGPLVSPVDTPQQGVTIYAVPTNSFPDFGQI